MLQNLSLIKDGKDIPEPKLGQPLLKTTSNNLLLPLLLWERGLSLSPWAQTRLSLPLRGKESHFLFFLKEHPVASHQQQQQQQRKRRRRRRRRRQQQRRHLEVDIERADLREAGGDADRRDAVELGRQLAVLAEPRHDLVLGAGSDLRNAEREGCGHDGGRGGVRKGMKARTTRGQTP